MLIFRATLKENLAKHQLWLETHGDKGQRFSAAGANFEKTDLSGANLRKANLSGTNLSEANLSNADLTEATLFGVKLSGANLNAANLSGASLSGAELQNATLQNADLAEVLLCEANLVDANLSNANLHRANLSLGIPEFVKAKNIQTLLLGSATPFVNINQTNLKGANLSGANLSEANLDFANLFEANLSGASLQKSRLFAVNLSKANLSGANLEGADLFRVKALGTDFSSANLTDACIEEWMIDRDTKLDDVICDSIYLKHLLRSLPDYILRKFSDRRPFNPKAKFAQGDFVKLLSRGHAGSELEKHGSEILQEHILIEELHQIFEQLSEQYLQRYVDASESDRLTILKLELRYLAKGNLAFRERLLEVINLPSQLLADLLQNNSFVSLSPETLVNFL
jgi:uncharacterized protein YjbI with pentapeptide repeats